MVFTHFGEPHRGQIEPFLSAPRLKHRVWRFGAANSGECATNLAPLAFRCGCMAVDSHPERPKSHRLGVV